MVEPGSEFTAAPAKHEQPATAACPTCGRLMKADAKFCTSCGGKMNDQAPISQPTRAEPEFKQSAERQPLKFRLRSADRLKASEYINSGNICWLAGLIFFIVAAALPLGILPPEKVKLGISAPWPVAFPKLFIIPYAAILISMALSAMNFDIPGGLSNKTFRLASATAGAVYIFMFLLAGSFVHAGVFVTLLIFYGLFLLLARKSEEYLARFGTFTAAALLADIYTMIVSLFLKSELLANTGAGLSANRGYYANFAALLFTLAGCLIKKASSPDA